MRKFFLSTFLILVLVLVLGYSQYNEEPHNPRLLIESNIEGAKKSKKLSSGEEQLLRLQLAIIDYVTNKGVPPNSLDELIPTYFDALPKDSKTNQVFAYVREGRNYKLGAQVNAPPVQLAKKDEQQSGLSQQALETALATDGFINPNTMEADTFVYDTIGKRDPFLPFNHKKTVIRDDATPLERYGLGQLRVAAVMNGPDGQPIALVEDEGGKGFNVRVGTKIGDSNGVVTGIELLPPSVKIVERNVDFSGVETEKLVEMKIQPKQQVQQDKAGKKNTPAASPPHQKR